MSDIGKVYLFIYLFICIFINFLFIFNFVYFLSKSYGGVAGGGGGGGWEQKQNKYSCKENFTQKENYVR